MEEKAVLVYLPTPVIKQIKLHCIQNDTTIKDYFRSVIERDLQTVKQVTISASK